MELQGKKIVFLGDSITEGIGVKNPENIYWKRFENDGCQVYGYGVMGSKIAKQQSHFTKDYDHKYFRSRVPEMETNADIVVVFGGSNDFGHGDAVIGHMWHRTDDSFYGALHLLYTDLINKYPKATIVVATPLHRPDEQREWNEIGLGTFLPLEGYVDIIKEVAAYYSFPVWDCYRNSGINPSLEPIKKYYMADGVHPNDNGHEILYRRLKGFLQSI